jgi:general secretion pathway protein I
VKHSRGFTLLEVLVALVIVAFGMGAVLAALSSSADNISSLREKTVAQWVAMNQIADARLNSNLPKRGVTEGDVKNFGGIDWHWRQDVMAVEMVPGLMEIAVRVRRATPGSSRSSSSGGSTTASTPQRVGSGNNAGSSGAPSSFFGSSGGTSSSGAFGASSGLGALRSGMLSSSSSSANRNIGATSLPSTGDDQHWIATVVGFRGDALGQPTGESPDWGSPCTTAIGASSGTTSGTANSASSGANPCSNASSSSGASSSGNATIGPSNTTQPSQSSTSSGSTGTNQP